jgi:hypothetical protein
MIKVIILTLVSIVGLFIAIFLGSTPLINSFHYSGTKVVSTTEYNNIAKSDLNITICNIENNQLTIKYDSHTNSTSFYKKYGFEYTRDSLLQPITFLIVGIIIAICCPLIAAASK